MKKLLSFIVWTAIILGMSWVLSGLVTESYRYTCLDCKKPQWQKGWTVDDKEICDKDWDKRDLEYREKHGLAIYEVDGWEEIIHDKIRAEILGEK